MDPILLSQILMASYSLGLVVAFWKRKHLSRSLRIFSLYVTLCLLISCITFGFIWMLQFYEVYMFIVPTLTKFKIADNAFLFVLFSLNNTVMLGWFYGSLLRRWIQPRLFSMMVIMVFAFEVFVYFAVDGYSQPGQVNPVVDSVFCFCLPAIYLWLCYRQDRLMVPFLKNSYVLISIGLIGENLLVFIYFVILQKLYHTDKEVYATATSIKTSIQILTSFLYIAAFYRARYTRFLIIESSPEFSKSSVK